MIQNIVKHIHFESFSFNTDTINTHNYFTSFSKFFIQNKENRAPTMDDYDHLNYAKIFDIQYENLKNNFIWIVNTCILILIDYKPKNFFDQITKHETSFKLPYIEQS